MSTNIKFFSKFMFVTFMPSMYNYINLLSQFLFLPIQFLAEHIYPVEEWNTNLVSLAILFHSLCAKHVSDINKFIIRSLRLCCWITTSVVLFSVRCVLEIWFGWVWVVPVLQAEAQLSWRMKDQLDVTCYLFHSLCAQHVSDINISIIRSLRLCC